MGLLHAVCAVGFVNVVHFDYFYSFFVVKVGVNTCLC